MVYGIAIPILLNPVIISGSLIVVCVQTLDKPPERFLGLIRCGNQLLHVLQAPPLEAFKTWPAGCPAKMTMWPTRSPPHRNRSHIPAEWHLLPFVSSQFQKCRHPLRNMIPSYPRLRLTPFPMSCSFKRGAQNPETTCSGKRGSPAVTRKSMGG